MHSKPLSRRHRGSSAGWVIVLLALLTLAAVVSYRIVKSRQDVPVNSNPTTRPDSD